MVIKMLNLIRVFKLYFKTSTDLAHLTLNKAFQTIGAVQV